MEDVTYKKLTIYAINRINKEYGSIAAFCRHDDCKTMNYKKSNGKTLPSTTIRQYLSYSDNVKLNKSYKFLVHLFKKLWNKTVIYKEEVTVNIILKADLY